MSISFDYIPASRQKEWEELVSKNEASGFGQSFFWTEFKSKTGWQTNKIAMYSNETIVGGAVIMKYQFSKTKNFLYISQGPVIPFVEDGGRDLFESLISEIHVLADREGDNRTTHLRIEPRIHLLPEYFDNFKKAPFNLEPKSTLYIDLSKSETEILQQMKPKGRYNINLAQKHQMVVRESCSMESLEMFWELYSKTTTRNNFEGKPKLYFETLMSTLQKTDHGTCFVATHKGIPCAAAIILFFGNTVTYFFGASSDENKEKMASYLLQWEIIKNVKNRGYHWYDFWGVAPKEADKDHPWFGFSEFKMKFGGERRDYIGAYDYIYNESLYREFLHESKELKD